MPLSFVIPFLAIQILAIEIFAIANFLQAKIRFVQIVFNGITSLIF